MRTPNAGNIGRRSLASALGVVVCAGSVFADIDPNSGIDFVRIGAVGNAPWMGNGTPDDLAIGRGSVGYEYSIGRFEVTTFEWTEFFNAAYDRSPDDRLPHLLPPDHWGAVPTTPNTPGGLRWRVPAGNEMHPVGDISWRMAAMYCNWLCNDKSTARSAFLNGAYDVSTFGRMGNVFTDQLAHNQGARYWIPTWDEHLKASHYDPDLNGGQGGWWTFNNASNTEPISGPPTSMGGIGEANAAWPQSMYPGVNRFAIPLGAYDATSPWGLYDTAGATAEWTESVVTIQGIHFRFYDGSWWLDGPTVADRIDAVSADFPNIPTFEFGFRIATSVPGPPSGMLLVLSGAWAVRRKTRRRSWRAHKDSGPSSCRRPSCS